MQNIQSKTTATSDKSINWGNAIFVTLFHIGAVAALFFTSWIAVICAVILYWVAGSLGIGMGFHRLLTHRGYKVPKGVEYFLAICGTLALEGGPTQWVTTHRLHHAHADHQGDPHTPRDGRWWAHIGWVLRGRAQRHEEDVLAHYSPDLMKNSFYIWLNRLHFLPILLVGIALLVFGGWGVMLWGVFLRVTLGLHATWLVNSATHLWGKQRFDTGEDSRNSWWVAMLTFGEGWHNNHHAHPTSARHGFKWYEFDINWWGIRGLQLIGLARGIKRVRFDRTATMWQLVTGKSKSESSYEGA